MYRMRVKLHWRRSLFFLSNINSNDDEHSYIQFLHSLNMHQGMERVKDYISTKKQLTLTKKLFKLVREGNGDKLEKLLAHPHVNVHAIEPDGNTALHVAAQYATPSVIKLLVAKGALLDAQDTEGNTPLHIALQLKWKNPLRAKNLSCLLNQGARIDIPNVQGVIPYLEYIINKPFVRAIYEKNYALLKRYLAQGANVNMELTQIEAGIIYNPPIYPLDCALKAKEVCPEMVNFLLDTGADLKLCNIEHLVTWVKDDPQWPMVEIIRHLIKHVPRSLIRTQWNLQAIPLLLCLKEFPALPTDIRNLLCYYHIRSSCIAAQNANAKTICLQLKRTRRPQRLQPLIEPIDLINPTKLEQHYPVWYEQIKKAVALQNVSRKK